MATSVSITPETVTRTTLDNGLVLLIKPNHNNASITLRGRIRAGAMYDTDQTAGLAHFATAALQRGTKKRTFQELNQELDLSGMSFGVGAGMETIGFSGKSLTEDFDHLLDVASDVLMNPRFPRGETEKLRNEILADLKEADQDTQHVAYREFRSLCYPTLHPFHRLSDGRAETVKKVQIKDLKDFHDRYFRPDIATMVIVGDIDPTTAIEKVQRAFAKWEGSGMPPSHILMDAPQLQTVNRKQVQLPGKTQLDLILGNVGLKRTDPDYYALSLGDLIFGRLGLYGRLGASVRDRQGLAYYVYSSLEASMGAGPWAVHAGVNPKGLNQAIEGILGEIRLLRSKPVTQDELDEAKDFVTGSLALRLETNDGQAATLSDIELFDLGLDYLERYPGIVRSITPEQILAVSLKYADPDKYALSIAGPLE